jgi:MYXO-CTERM domain-containing protein
MNASPRRIAVLGTMTFAFAASLHLAPRSASACSPACPVVVIPYEGQSLPTKVRALPVPYSNGVQPVLTLGGVVVPSTIEVLEDESRLLVPTTPLADGAYSLSYEQQCGGSDKATAAFQVGAIVAEPHATGTLRVATQFVAGVKSTGEANGGGCGSSELAYDHVVAQITFDPAPELSSYLSLTRFSADLAASGQPWKRTFAVSPAQTAAPFTVATFTASCEANPPPNEAPGVLTMSVFGQIAGADARLATSTAAIDLTCPPGGIPSESAPPSGTSGSSGCSVGASGSGGPASGLAALGLGGVALAVTLRRRRRAR